MKHLPQFKTLMAVRSKTKDSVWLRVLENGEANGEAGEFSTHAYLLAARVAKETKQPDKIILEWFYANF